MKRRFLLYVNIAVAAVAMLASCNKSDDGVVCINATINDYGNNDKVYVDNDRYTWWNDQDQVYINGTTYALTVSNNIATIANVTADQNGYYAVYPAGMCGTAANGYPTVTLPQRQVYRTDGTNQILNAPMADFSGNEHPALNFTNLCSLLKVTLPDDRLVAAIVVSNTTANLWGTCTLSGTDNPTLSTPANGGKTVMLDCGDGVSSANGKPFYVVLPGTNLSNLQVKVIVYKTVSGVKYTEIYDKQSTANPQLVPNMVYTFSVPTDATYTEPYFSTASRTHVRFAPGNLQYQASTNTWRFAPNEWEAYRNGGGNTAPSATNENWIDLFSYGTSGETFTYTTGLWPLQQNHTVNNYPWTNDGGLASATNGHFYGDNISGTEYDWGWHNPISNGGNAVHLWRTPTKEEWYYLIADRSSDAHLADSRDMPRGIPQASLASITLEGGSTVNGLIIFPDNVTLAVGDNVSSLTANRSTKTWDEWRYLDLNGAAFLPYSAIRNGPYGFIRSNTEISEVNTGQYWSGSTSGAGTDLQLESSHIIFPTGLSNNSLDPRQGSFRYWGLAVREVQTIQ